MSIKRQLIESAVTKIVRKVMSEAAKNLNLPLSNCNLYVKGWGLDKNGNMRILVGFPNDRGFPIQTNGVLKNTHQILQRAGSQLSEDDLNVIGSEVLSYVQKFGPATVKSRLKVYGK